MGIIPKPIVVGAPCLRCFGALTTPQLIKVFFSGIMTGDDWTPDHMLPPNGYHDYIQHPVNTCQWRLIQPGPLGTLSFAAGNSGISIYEDIAHRIFWDLIMVNCHRYFSNRQNNPAGEHWYGGNAFVCTEEELEGWLNLVTPTTGPDPRLELYPMDNGEIVLKFCDIQSATNVKIKLDSALL